MKQPLSKRQNQVLRFILSFNKRMGFMPTLVEMGQWLEITPITVLQHLNYIERKGWIKRSLGKARWIKIL